MNDNLNKMLQNKEKIYSDIFEYIKNEEVEGFTPTGINEIKDKIKIIESWIKSNVNMLFEICIYYKKIKKNIDTNKDEIQIIQDLAEVLIDFSPMPLKLAIFIVDKGMNRFCQG